MRFFVPNPRFADEIKGQDEYREGLQEIAGEVKRQAEPIQRQASGPWIPRKGQSEQVAVGEDSDGVYVALTEHGGHLIEYGSKNNPPHAPLRRGARAAGLEVDENF